MRYTLWYRKYPGHYELVDHKLGTVIAYIYDAEFAFSFRDSLNAQNRDSR